MAVQPYRILIVDHSSEERDIYKRLLGSPDSERYVFADAADMEEAKTLWQSFQPDCVLLDFQLAHSEATKVLSNGHASSTAVVMLTSVHDEEAAAEHVKLDAHDYLVKPRISQETLQRTVDNCIEKVHLQHELESKQKELEKLAHEDDLTGLHNRRYFLERLRQEMERAQRYQANFSVLMLDVDHFKKVNDTYGHSTGDQVLMGVSKLLKSCLRSSDLAARYGGEEFCVLATNTDRNGACAFAERVRSLIAGAKFTAPNESEFSVTCSIGVVSSVGSDVSAAKIIDWADEAMYEAKRAGRNCVRTFLDDSDTGDGG